MGLEEGFIPEAVTEASEGGEGVPCGQRRGCTSRWEGGSEKTSWRKGLRFQMVPRVSELVQGRVPP